MNNKTFLDLSSYLSKCRDNDEPRQVSRKLYLSRRHKIRRGHAGDSSARSKRLTMQVGAKGGLQPTPAANLSAFLCVAMSEKGSDCTDFAQFGIEETLG